MASGPTRQHYSLATGGALNAGDTSTKVLKYAKGGGVKGSAYFQGTNASGARVSGANSDNKYMGKPKLNPSRLSGDDKFTSITHKGKQIPKGFKVQKP